MQRTFRLLCEEDEVITNTSSDPQLSPDEADEAKSLKMSPADYVQYRRELLRKAEMLRRINEQAQTNPSAVARFGSQENPEGGIEQVASFVTGTTASVMQGATMMLVTGAAANYIGKAAGKVWDILTGGFGGIDAANAAYAADASAQVGQNITGEMIDSSRGGVVTTSMAWLAIGTVVAYACMKLYEWFREWWEKRQSSKQQTAAFQNVTESTLCDMSYINRRSFELYALDEMYVPLQEGFFGDIVQWVKGGNTNKAVDKMVGVINKSFAANTGTTDRIIVAMKQGKITTKQAKAQLTTLAKATPKLIRAANEGLKIKNQRRSQQSAA